MPQSRKLAAYLLPISVFVGLLVLNSVLKKTGDHFLLSSAEYWIYPTQTVVCGALVLWFWREYQFGQLRCFAFTISIGVLVFLLWISPQQFLGFPARTIGFNPDILVGQPAAYWATVVFRFLRFAVVVPFVEEIFWRGFLLRFVIREDFESVPLGTFSWLSFAVVTLAFGFSHTRPDWIAALITGMLYNGVAYRTKSLSSCILTHASTNLLLGLWIMNTKQWGFW
jgi:CAAX prenyl protease-like protein